MAICHTVESIIRNGNRSESVLSQQNSSLSSDKNCDYMIKNENFITYTAASPDEKALVEICHRSGKSVVGI